MLYGAVRFATLFAIALMLRSVQDFSSTFSQLEEQRAEQSARKLKAMEEHMQLVRDDILQRRKETKMMKQQLQLQSQLLMALLQKRSGVPVENRIAGDSSLSSDDSDDD